MKKQTFAIIFIFFMLSISIHLAGQEIETVDGVRVVHNEEGGKRGKDLPVKIELVRTIGDINTLDENLAFNTPSDIVLDDDGNMYILDAGNCRVQKFDPEGRLLCRWGSSGSGEGQFQTVSSIAVDSTGHVYVADGGNCRVQKFTGSGEFLAQWGTEGTGDGQFDGLFFKELAGGPQLQSQPSV